jgi:hypothetical protein
MLLYCNGDSFVQGTELADDILPGYPGLLPWPPNTPQHEQHKEWLAQTNAPTIFTHSNGRGSKMLDINRLELERAFPNKVHIMTGIPVTNRAIAGGSMDHIVRNSITDLYTLKKENPNEQVVACVGTTYPGRWEIANDQLGNHDLHMRPQDWICVSGIYCTASDNDYLRDMRRYKAMYETDYHQLVNFYKNIVLLQDFCKLNEITLHWIATFDNVLKQPGPTNGYAERPDINVLMEYANLNYTVDMREIMETEFAGQSVICPGGHFGEQIHHRIAEEIVKILGKM